MSRGQLLSLLDILPTGAHKYSRHLNFRQVTKVKVEAGPGIVSVDGEVIRHEGILEIECLKHEIPFFLPSKFSPLSLRAARKSKKK